MDYDLVVIGAGWAGFNAALRARELGLKAALVEKDKIGGTCLNRGCIPTKTLIQSAKAYQHAKKAATFGINISSVEANFSQIQARKEKIVLQLQQGMQFMLKGVDFISGAASFIDRHTLKAGGRELKAENFLLATGSRPFVLPGLEFDGKKILSSDEILDLKEIPQSLLIVGGGVIGCEFASLFQALGAQVTLVEKMPQLLPAEDAEVAKKLESFFKKKGIKINTNCDAASLDLNNFSLILVCVGRVAYLENLGLENLGLKIEKGRLATDEYLRTSIAHILAAGDCTAKTMLAHYAAYQGKIAAQNIARPALAKKADNLSIPNCIFTEPQIASIGISEEKARANGLEAEIKKIDFLGSGMARIMEETEGFIKIISDKKTSRIIGAAIIGPQATELIGILTLAVTSGLKVEQIKETIFAHPTLSEAIAEAIK